MAYAPPLTVYVLVPGGQGAAPLVLRLDAASTIRTAKHAIERQRPSYSRAQLSLHLPSGGGPLREADTLGSIGLTGEDAPTLLLRVEGSNPALHSVLESVVAPALEAAEAAAEAATASALEAAERAAAMRIQSVARSIFARRELAWRLKARRLLALCARTEDRAADVIEHRVRAWAIRAHAEVRRREQNQRRAAAAIAAVEAEAAALAHGARLQEAATFIARVWRVRRALRQAATTRRLEARVGGGESSVEMVAAISAAAGVDYSRAAALPAPRPVGLVHVQVGFRTIGRYQLVSWRRAYAYATRDALCHQPVRRAWSWRAGDNQMAKGPSRSRRAPSRVPFASIRRVGVQMDDPLVLVIQVRRLARARTPRRHPLALSPSLAVARVSSRGAVLSVGRRAFRAHLPIRHGPPLR